MNVIMHSNALQFLSKRLIMKLQFVWNFFEKNEINRFFQESPNPKSHSVIVRHGIYLNYLYNEIFDISNRVSNND